MEPFFFGYTYCMESKSLVWLGAAVGSTLGGMVPLLWGGSTFSFSSIILGGVGAIVGIYAGFKVTQ